MKIFISTTTFARYNNEPLKLLKDAGIKYDLNPYNRKLKECEIEEILKKNSYDGLIAGTEPLTSDVLKNARSLKVISRAGVGLDNLDLASAKKLNLKVYNTPYVLIDSVAELTIGLIICCLRRVTSMDAKIRSNVWKKEMGLLFRDKVLGIIGFGRIGKRVAQLARAFGTKVIFYDLKTIKPSLFRQVSLNKLLSDSDIISIHSSAKDTLIARKEISRVKKGLILVNTSRGSVVNEDSLCRGLRSGKISFAALDVYNNEPYSGKLLKLDNIIFTPHIGSYAKEARIKMETEAVKNLINGLKIAGRGKRR